MKRKKKKEEEQLHSSTQLLIIAFLVLLCMLLSSCNTKKHFVQNNAINAEKTERLDSAVTDGNDVKVAIETILTENKAIDKDIDITFEGEIKTIDLHGNTTTMNGTLNLTQKEKDNSVIEQKVDSQEERRDSIITKVTISNDSTFTDASVTEEKKKSNAAPVEFIAILLCGLMLIFFLIWKRVKNQ